MTEIKKNREGEREIGREIKEKWAAGDLGLYPNVEFPKVRIVLDRRSSGAFPPDGPRNRLYFIYLIY